MQRAIRAIGAVDWRSFLPPRSGWLRLLASPTSIVLVAGFLMTLHAKAKVLRLLEGVSAWPFVLLWTGAIDAVVYLGFAALFAAGEARSRWMGVATIPLSLLIASLALVNASYMSITGEQLTWDAVELGFSRFEDVVRIVSRVLSWKTAVIVTVLVGGPVLLRWQLRARTGPWQQRAHAFERAHCAAAVAVVGVLLALVTPSPSSLAVQDLGKNATIDTYVGWLTTAEEDTISDDLFQGYDPPHLVTGATIDALRARPSRPNVLLVVLESTRYDHTSLAPPELSRGTDTPNLLALARRGTSATRTRAVLPHTTKSVFSMLCGRYPTMQQGIIEYSANLDIQCVPEILTRAGWDTAFFQSAWGTFEERPRLVDKLGYAHFQAWEDIQGSRVGYLASDDMSLAPALAAWLDARPPDAGPFFATLLTSATHHTYEIPAGADTGDKPVGTDEERYARLVEREDQLLGAVLADLDRRGVLDDTLVVAVGDHGEGFGQKRIMQHDNNFYEEGLRVPLVFAGPGVPAGHTIDANVSLVDLAPTLLGLVGADLARDAYPTVPGVNLFAGEVPARTLLFSCWFELRCRGFVSGTDKVVYRPTDGRAFWFDLGSDPHEREARQVPRELRDFIPKMSRVLDGFRTRAWKLQLGPLRHDYGPWRCPRNRRCTHPNAKPFSMGH